MTGSNETQGHYAPGLEGIIVAETELPRTAP